MIVVLKHCKSCAISRYIQQFTVAHAPATYITTAIALTRTTTTTTDRVEEVQQAPPQALLHDRAHSGKRTHQAIDNICS